MQFKVSCCVLLAISLQVEGVCAQAADCNELGPALTEHSCFHATFGPWTTVTAAAGVPAPAAAPSVDAVHTFYDVRLSDAGGENTVSYKIAGAARAGEWAIFHDPLIPLRVLAPSGDVLVPTLDTDVAGCPYLPRTTVYRLEDERYRLVLGPAAVTRAILVIENVTDFVSRNGRDSDGDGYGDKNDFISTLCAPPQGYVANAADCDDSNPAMHPGAPETCDGVDQNCNGVPDDEGLQCASGKGACQTKGTLSCTAAGQPATCSAVTRAPSAESCNGTDDDCDGLPDDREPDLCGTADAPACVLVVGKWTCGCSKDADCGDSRSGRYCDDIARLCQAGCIGAPGRNGCPSGLECTSTGVASPGACIPPCVGADCVDAGRPGADDAGTGGTAGAGGSSAGGASTGGVGAPNPDAGSASGGSADENPPKVEGGCGCRTAGRGSPAGAASLAAFLFLAGCLRRRRRLAAAVSLALGSSACGGVTLEQTGSDPSSGGSGSGGHGQPSSGGSEQPAGGGSGAGARGGNEPDACVPRLGPKLISHACSHGTNGPFIDVVAGPGPGSTTPDVSPVHRLFRVAGTSSTGFVSYVPSRSGPHAIFTSSGDVQSFHEGQLVPTSSRDDVGGCSVFTRSGVVDLRTDEVYVLEMTVSTELVSLFIEHLGTFGPAAWTRCDP